MVREADQYKREDDTERERIEAKMALLSYAFNMKRKVQDEKLKDKISEADRKAILDKCQEVIPWLDSNQLAEKEEIEQKQKEVEAFVPRQLLGSCIRVLQEDFLVPGTELLDMVRTEVARGAGGPTIEESD